MRRQCQTLLILSGIMVLGFGVISFIVFRGFRNRLFIFINCLCHTPTLALIFAGFLFALKGNRHPEDRALRTDANLNARKPRRYMNFSWYKALFNETESKITTAKIASSPQKTILMLTRQTRLGKNIINQNESVSKKSRPKAEFRRQNKNIGQNETFAMDKKTQEKKESFIKLGAWSRRNDNNENNKGEYVDNRDHIGTDDDCNIEHCIDIGRKYFKILGEMTAIPATLGFIAFLVIA